MKPLNCLSAVSAFLIVTLLVSVISSPACSEETTKEMSNLANQPIALQQEDDSGNTIQTKTEPFAAVDKDKANKDVIFPSELEQLKSTQPLLRKKPKLIIADFLDETDGTYNSNLLCETATILFEAQAMITPAFNTIPQTRWYHSLPSIDPDKPEVISPEIAKKLFEEYGVTLIGRGKLLSFTETHLSGGWLVFGVRKLRYIATMTFTISDSLKGSVLYHHRTTTSTIDKSVGFKRIGVHLTPASVSKLIYPFIDQVSLDWVSVITEKLRKK